MSACVRARADRADWRGARGALAYRNRRGDYGLPRLCGSTGAAACILGPILMACLDILANRGRGLDYLLDVQGDLLSGFIRS